MLNEIQIFLEDAKASSPDHKVPITMKIAKDQLTISAVNKHGEVLSEISLTNTGGYLKICVSDEKDCTHDSEPHICKNIIIREDLVSVVKF